MVAARIIHHGSTTSERTFLGYVQMHLSQDKADCRNQVMQKHGYIGDLETLSSSGCRFFAIREGNPSNKLPQYGSMANSWVLLFWYFNLHSLATLPRKSESVRRAPSSQQIHRRELQDHRRPPGRQGRCGAHRPPEQVRRDLPALRCPSDAELCWTRLVGVNKIPKGSQCSIV